MCVNLFCHTAHFMFLSLSSMSRNYLKLTDCMEYICSLLGCFFPNRVVEQLFVRIHQQYFSLCNNEEDLSDAPAGVVLVSTLLPILLIPFIVYIVVWKSSLRDWPLLRYPGWVKVIQILSSLTYTHVWNLCEFQFQWSCLDVLQNVFLCLQNRRLKWNEGE